MSRWPWPAEWRWWWRRWGRRRGGGVTDPTNAPQTFLVRPGVYGCSRDRGGVRFLRFASEYRVPSLVGFVNSAPLVWTTDRRSCGGALAPGSERAFGQYLADVVRHLRSADGIKLSFVSPMNEPDFGFGVCTQEGMSVPVAARAEVVRAVGKARAAKAPFAHVIADESSAFQFLPEVSRWLAASDTARWVAALAHHGYQFLTDREAAPVASLARRFDKPLWMTEVGFGPGYDPGMTNAIRLADTIWQDLIVIGDSAFDWWTAVSKGLGCDAIADPTCPYRQNGTG